MKTKEKKLKVYTLDQIKDEMIGKNGTTKRDSYEFEINLAIKSIDSKTPDNPDGRA